MTSKIEFTLFAPNNKGAALIGYFSDWKEIPMKKGEDGYFRTQVELEDGVYYYKFRIQTKSPNFEPDQWVDVIDPYATDVDEVKKIGVVRIKDGKRIVDTYVWQHDDMLLPENHEIVIYEMHIADPHLGELS
jgi:1,4-alpha-glucan branching enzyme